MADNCTIDLNDYFCSDVGLVLPFFSEYTWHTGARAFIYFAGLFWCFLGVAIIADIFMCSIEKITSRTRIIKVASMESEKGYEEIEVKVWNDTVANLTLMALGSSAPEILLSCIELMGNNFKAGQLGPSTIVGSAAFNLLVITAVCVLSIPDGEFRRIKHIKVFIVTASFSVFAYLWLIIILVANTPNYVDLWEAILTFIFFPVMVILAYVADKDFCNRKKVDDSKVELGFKNEPELYPNVEETGTKGAATLLQNGTADDGVVIRDHPEDERMTDAKMREFMKELRQIHPHLPEETIAKLAASKMEESRPHNHLWYRINATRSLGGNPTLLPKFDESDQEVYENLNEPHEDLGDMIGSTTDFSENNAKAVIEFTASQSAVLEQEQRVRLGIKRWGKLNCRVLFKLETIDGTAEAEKDYIPIKQTLVFEKDEKMKFVDVEIIDDNEWEPDEVFFVKLSLDSDDPGSHVAVIGKKSVQEVTIINDDEPGTFDFMKPSLLFKESAGKAMIPVERSNGADGKVEIEWKTEDMTAKAGKDFEGGSGTLIFEHGEMTKMLEITIFDDQEQEKDECFKVDLMSCSEGAKLGRIRKTIVTIVNDDDFNGMVSRLVDMANMNMDALRVDSNTYADQFRNAMNVNGGDIESATNMDYVMHFCTLAWKILFAFVPPVSVWGGWLSFFIALMMIAILTTIIGDLASIAGCLVTLKDSVTAITFVALGTSLPDLFASKQAATMEKTADNSIGNVTGSNSVNVFLGLGLPWVIASIYWTAKGKTFEVQAGSLAFSVVIYTVCACICIGLLLLRRYLPVFGKAELGGAKIPKIICAIFFVFLWVMYVLLSSLQAYGHINAEF